MTYSRFTRWASAGWYTGPEPYPPRNWDDALALGNACASRYVATGATAGREMLVAWIEAGASAQK
ncbi:hypothetical protein HUG10_17890 [Halorarum halophilum]|uniref:Uncharacterized protein n=1 Tax=Halorarum halophilum TaxID=2743090 RepID=A0A7D5GGP8_9EURY|nr:hypothetical protein [Halobaculum halophilum]QLG29288.1 hypothetical protein HUG10_17890 [Halobaculum halophilum]